VGGGGLQAAPLGRYNVAQGNALGWIGPKGSSPERAV